MTSNSPAEDEVFRQLTGLPRSLSHYWASDRDATGELMEKQEIFTEQASHLAAEQEHDRQEAFAALNPDFGVLPDSRDPQQHRFAQQRERALALGERVAAAELSQREHGEPPDIVSFPPAQVDRAAGQRQAMRRLLLEGYQRRQALRMERAEQDRER
jgi:hypothetical protein